MDEILFFLFGPIAVVAALGAVTLRNPFYAVLSLVMHLLALSMLFLLLYAQFVAVVQVMVYVGAVMVLYVFVNAYVGGTTNADGSTNVPQGGSGPNLRLLSYGVAALLAVTVGIAVLGTGLQAIDDRSSSIEAGFGSPSAIGELLLTRFLLPFEGASFLLLVAAVGAVVLARRRGGVLPDEERMISASELLAPTGTGSMREGVGAINPNPGARSVALGGPDDERSGGSSWSGPSAPSGTSGSTTGEPASRGEQADDRRRERQDDAPSDAPPSEDAPPADVRTPSSDPPRPADPGTPGFDPPTPAPSDEVPPTGASPEDGHDDEEAR
ncbi:MAG: NADH-quinone oxidoreductase subunit J [Patulibacter sp.]|nr:NADH-quinone oxidoreductase subunit J [Patulibacter sp.]